MTLDNDSLGLDECKLNERHICYFFIILSLSPADNVLFQILLLQTCTQNFCFPFIQLFFYTAPDTGRAISRAGQPGLSPKVPDLEEKAMVIELSPADPPLKQGGKSRQPCVPKLADLQQAEKCREVLSFQAILNYLAATPWMSETSSSTHHQSKMNRQPRYLPALPWFQREVLRNKV